jgi:hypothetical protein
MSARTKPAFRGLVNESGSPIDNDNDASGHVVGAR